MARIFSTGFEDGGLSQFGNRNSATVISSSGLAMDGNYCLNLSSQSSFAVLEITPDSEYYLAFLWRPTSLSLSLNVLGFYFGTTILGQIRCNTSGSLEAYSGTSKVATGSPIININTTRLIEIYIKIDDATGRIVVKIDGIVDIDYTGDTKPGADTQINKFWWGNISSAYSSCYLDNIICDNASWIGATKIQGLLVTGAGNSTQWTPSSTGDNYACVDEVPASSTDWVETNTNDQVDTYTLADLTGSIASIKSVQVQALVIKEGDPTPQNLKLAVRSGGTDYLSSEQEVPYTNAASLYNIWETDPDTSSAWSELGVNAIEIGAKSAS